MFNDCATVLECNNTVDHLLSGDHILHDVLYMLMHLYCICSISPLICCSLHCSFLSISAQSFKEFAELLNTVEEERRRLVRMQL